jgi:hypothetical protein
VGHRRDGQPGAGTRSGAGTQRNAPAADLRSDTSGGSGIEDGPRGHSEVCCRHSAGERVFPHRAESFGRHRDVARGRDARSRRRARDPGR